MEPIHFQYNILDYIEGGNYIFNPGFVNNSKGWRDFSRYNKMEIYNITKYDKRYLMLMESSDLPWNGIMQPVDLRNQTTFLAYGYYELTMEVDYINLCLDGNFNIMLKPFSKDYTAVNSYDSNYILTVPQRIEDQVLKGMKHSQADQRSKELERFMRFNGDKLDVLTSRATLTMYSKKPINYVNSYIYTEKNGVVLISNVSMSLRHVSFLPEVSEKLHQKRYPRLGEDAIAKHHERVGGLFQYTDRNLKRKTVPFYRKSYKPFSRSDDITVVGQLDVTRFDRLLECSRNWDGLISAVLYIKDDQDKAQLDQMLADDNNKRALDNIDIHLAYKKERETLYPVNELRNIAIDLSKTDWVFTIDIDFVISPRAHDFIRANIKENAQSGNTMFVVAAFELDGYTMNNTEIYPSSKEKMIELMKDGQSRSIHKRISSVAHDATDYDQWVRSVHPYKVFYQEHWEPYGVFHRSILPYDDKLAGYGWDKVSHTYQLSTLNFHFVVLPDPFIIHLAHNSTSWAQRTVQDRIMIFSNWYESITEFTFKYHPNLFNPIDMKQISTLNTDRVHTIWQEFEINT